MYIYYFIKYTSISCSKLSQIMVRNKSDQSFYIALFVLIVIHKTDN